MKINFEIIPFYFFKKSFSNAYLNLAFDEFLFNQVEKNNYEAIFRIYQWKRPAISIGYFQKISSININLTKQFNIPIIRRITGGRAIYHDINEITLSIILNSKIFNLNTYSSIKKRDIFLALSENFISIFKKLDFPISINKSIHGDLNHPNCFATKSIAEIVNKDGNKIFGSALFIKSSTLINQISIPFASKDFSKINFFLSNQDNDFQNTKDINLDPIDTISIIKKNLFTHILKKSLLNIQKSSDILSNKKKITKIKDYKKKYESDFWLNLR